MTKVKITQAESPDNNGIVVGQWFLWGKYSDLFQLCLVEGESKVALINCETGKYFSEPRTVHQKYNITMEEFRNICKNEMFLRVKKVNISYEL